MSAGGSGLLLAFVALPALVIWLASLAVLVVGLMPHSDAVWAIGGAAGFIVSLPAMMAGAGIWGKWRYLWVFVTLPVVFVAAVVPMLLLFAPGQDSFLLAAGLAIFIALAAALGVAARVRASYR